MSVLRFAFCPLIHYVVDCVLIGSCCLCYLDPSGVCRMVCFSALFSPIGVDILVSIACTLRDDPGPQSHHPLDQLMLDVAHTIATQYGPYCVVFAVVLFLPRSENGQLTSVGEWGFPSLLPLSPSSVPLASATSMSTTPSIPHPVQAPPTTASTETPPNLPFFSTCSYSHFFNKRSSHASPSFAANSVVSTILQTLAGYTNNCIPTYHGRSLCRSLFEAPTAFGELPSADKADPGAGSPHRSYSSCRSFTCSQSPRSGNGTILSGTSWTF